MKRKLLLLILPIFAFAATLYAVVFTYPAGTEIVFTDSVFFGTTGVKVTNDADGAITFLGSSTGADEDLTLNFDDTANSIVASSSTGAGINFSGMALTVGTLADSNGVALHTTFAAVGAGTAYTMTAAYANVTMGTTSPTIPITAAGTYIVWANVQLSFVGATYAAVNSATFRLQETTANVSLTDGERGDMLPVMTTITNLGPSIMIGPVEHITADTDDVIVIQGDLGALPSAGTVTATKATVYAVRIK